MARTTNAAAAAEYFNAMNSDRASLVLCSDSNSIKGGHGWDAAGHIAMKARYGLWAMAPLTPNNMGNHGYGYSAYETSDNQSGVAETNIAAALAAKFDWGSSTPGDFGDGNPGRRYCWVRQDTPGTDTGAPASKTTRTDYFGITIDPANNLPVPFDLTAALKFHLQIAEFRAATAYNDAAYSSHVQGTFRPNLRTPVGAGGDTPLVALQNCTMAAGGAGTEVWRDNAYTVSAGTSNATSVNFHPGSRFTFDLKSDLAIGYMSVESTGTTRGCRVATLGQRGGGSLRQFAVALQAATNDAIGGLLVLMHEQPNAAVSGKKRVCVRLCFGTNDQNDSNLDAFFGASASNTEDGYYGNLVAVYQEIASAFIAVGGDATKLSFWVSQTPRLDSSYLSYQAAFATAAARFARDYDNPAGVRVWATDFSGITTESYLTANYYASGGTDKAHGTSATAYADILGKEIDALLADGSGRRKKAKRLRQRGMIAR